MRRNARKRWAAVKKAEEEQLRKILVHIIPRSSAATERPTSLPAVGLK